MKKIKIYLSLFFVLILLHSCGFKPIYSSSNLDLNFKDIDYKPTILNKQIVQALRSISNPNGTKSYDIKMNTIREKNIITKNSKGETEIYELKIILQLEIIDDGVKQNKNFSSKLNYNNSDNKFELNQYEIEIEKQIINDLVEEIISFFSNL